MPLRLGHEGGDDELALKVLLLPVGIAATAAVAAPTPREPTGKWVVNFADSQCLATRSYGSADEPLHLVLKAPPLRGVMQVTVMREGGYTPAAQVDATIGIDGQRPLKTNLLMFGTKSSKKRFYTINMPSADFSRIRGAKSLTISSSGLNETFSVSQIESLLKVMDECVANLRQVWNIAEDGETSKVAKPATADLYKAVHNQDYPDVAIRQGDSGVVRFVLLIDETGRVADCTVVETSGVAVLDAQSCALLRERAKFQPAIGLDGKPAKDSYAAKFRWVMP